MNPMSQQPGPDHDPAFPSRQPRAGWNRRIARQLAVVTFAAACFAAAHACNSSTPSQKPDPTPVISQSRKASYTETWDRSAFDHALWDAVVREHVNDQGLVDYARVAADARFNEYLYRLANTDAADLADDAQRLAFWINAYNALTIKAVLETLPDDRARWSDYSIKKQSVGGKNIWQGLEFQVGGGNRTLDEIEHEILRKQDGLRDPRIHLVLVCAARGCPKLWNRAYDPRRIDEQLSDAVRRYVKDPRQFRIDESSRALTLTQVFEWYGKDFTSPDFSPNAPTIPAFLAKYIPDPPLTRALNLEVWRVKYFDYDWSLNLAPAAP